MKKISIRKRIKETTALLLGALMVFATVGMPLQTVAESYSYGNPDQYPDSGLFMEGDTLSIEEEAAYSVSIASFDKTGITETAPDSGEWVTGAYYKNSTYVFPHEDAVFPDASSDNRLKTIYELTESKNTYDGYSLTFATYYGIQVRYLDAEGNTDRLDYTYYYVSDDNNLEEEFSSPGSLDDDEDLGEFIGWSTNPDYVDETSDGLYFEPEDGVTFDLIMDYVSDGVLVLYPIYHKEIFTSTMTVEMADYKAADARSVTNPAPEGYAGTDRTFSWEYFKTDAEGTVTDDTPVSTTPPADPGYYQVVVTAATKDEIPEETASANFKVTGTQSITFNPEGKDGYLGALGNTVLIPDLVSGVKDNATVHFQLITGNAIEYRQDHYVSAEYPHEYPGCKVQIIIDATDLYEAYTSEEFDFPITYCPWPEEECTVVGEKKSAKIDVKYFTDGEMYESGSYDVYDGDITILPPDGFTIPGGYGERHADGLDLPRGNLVRTEDEAITAWGNYLKGESVWLDNSGPSVMPDSVMIDGEQSDEEISAASEFSAKTVEFDVFDNSFYEEVDDEMGYTSTSTYSAMKSVTVDGVEVPTDTEYPGAKTHVKLTNNLPVSKTFTVVATDIADHETTWSITLSPDLGDTPNPAYIINGTEGNNGYYTSDVTLKAPTGYTISADDDDPDSYAEEIDYDETITQIRLKNTETGKYTDLVDVEEIMIDKDAPEITLFDGDEAVTSVNGKITLSGNDGLYIHAEDGNSGLLSATVNGKGLTIVDGTDARIQIYEDKTDREVVITVEDNAGNTDTRTFTLAAGTTTAGGEAEAVLNLVYDGTAKNLVVAKNVQNGTMMYSDTEDGYYTETVPSGTIATTYTIWYKVVGNEAVDPADGVTASKGYLDTEPASIEVTIAPLTAVLSWDDTEFEYDGEEHCPTAVVSNLVSGDTCNVTVTGAQTDAGSYTATAIGLSNSNYALPETNTTSFTIGKAVASIDVVPTANTLTYNGTEQALVSSGSATEGGKLVYRLEGGAYSDTVPVGKKAGEYKVYFKPVATDDNYESKSEEVQTTVTIAPKTLTVSWSDTTFTYDGKEHKPSATIGGICGTDNVIATVTGAKAAVGTYTATVSVSGTDASNYKLPENTSAEYTIKAKPADPVTPEKKAGSATVSMGSFVFGGKSTTPVVSSSTNDATKANISYKPSGAGDDAYTGSIPSAAGSYTVRAILPENDNYKGCVVYGSFTISYLEVPDGAYVLKGTVGNSDWYTSEVQLKPGDGYEISVGDRNSFSAASITLTEEMAGKTFFVRKKDTGEQSAGIKLMSLKIDTDSPELVDMEENGIYYGNDSNQLLGTAKDKNLYKVYVDGREVTTSTDENGNVIFELPLGKKREPVSVRIVDEAGNEKKISLTTAPGWMRTGEVGEGEYYLELGYAYKMPKNGSGLYVAGRPTRFMPGVTFFAKKEGSTEFEK